MAFDLTGRFIPSVWYMLYDDDYISDDRIFEIGIIFIYDTSMSVLRSVYYSASGYDRRERNLFFTAGSGCSDVDDMYHFNETYEKRDRKNMGINVK